MASRSYRHPGKFFSDVFQKSMNGYSIDIDTRAPESIEGGLKINVNVSDETARKIMQDILLYLGMDADSYNDQIDTDKVRANLDWVFEPLLPPTIVKTPVEGDK
jgi:hypothetical protein